MSLSDIIASALLCLTCAALGGLVLAYKRYDERSGNRELRSVIAFQLLGYLLICVSAIMSSFSAYHDDRPSAGNVAIWVVLFIIALAGLVLVIIFRRRENQMNADLSLLDKTRSGMRKQK